MLLNPTDKYVNYISNSAHYLNCPKHMFNFEINCLVRGYDREKAISNLRWFFKMYGFSLKEVDTIVDYHHNIRLSDFEKINENPYILNPPTWLETKTRAIDEWVKKNTEPVTYWNRFPSIPSYPFRTR